MSTKAINPSGNAIANETIAASSPSLDCSVDTSMISDNAVRWPIANSNRSRRAPVFLCLMLRVFNSEKPENDVMYAWACVPLTGMLNSFPANTFDVPSKPPEIKEEIVNTFYDWIVTLTGFLSY